MADEEKPSSDGPTKRPVRQRKPIVSMQEEYLQIYDPKNNRKGRNKNRSSSRPSAPEGDGTMVDTGEFQEGDNIAGDNSLLSPEEEHQDGILDIEDGIQEKMQDLSPERDLNIGDFVLVDSTLMRKLTYPEEELQESALNLKGSESAGALLQYILHGSATNSNADCISSKNNINSDAGLVDLIMNEKNPLIAQIENIKGVSGSTVFSLRWLYAKKEISNLNNFTDLPREDLLSQLTPRDLIWSNQVDTNEYDHSIIIARCRVIKTDQASGEGRDTKWAFRCRFKLDIEPENGTVSVSPVDGEDLKLNDDCNYPFIQFISSEEQARYEAKLAQESSVATTPSVEKDDESSENEEEQTPKRSRRSSRQRSSVVLMQDEYSQIYHPAYNRKMKAMMQEFENAKTSSSSGGAGTKRKAQSKSSSSTAKRGKFDKSSYTPPVYRWVDWDNQADEANTPSKNNTLKIPAKILEIKVGGFASLIQIGDCVLLSSSDLQDEDLYNKKEDDKSPVNSRAKTNTDSFSKIVSGKVKTKGLSEDDFTDSDHYAVNKLNPYVGQVTDLWEEFPQSSIGKKTRSQLMSSECAYSERRRTKMKVEIKWFYKKKDIKEIDAEFAGVKRQHILKTMTPRDLLLGDQTDVNEVSTILGKCRVLNCRPSSSNEKNLNGAFRCRYQFFTKPPSSASPKGIVDIIPNEESDEEEDVDKCKLEIFEIKDNAQEASDEDVDMEPSKASSEQDEEAKLKSSQDDTDGDVSSSGSLGLPVEEKKMSIGEGSNTQGEIHVGSQHQTTIPMQVEKEAYVSSRSVQPLMVWKPNNCADADVDKFLTDAAALLQDYAKRENIELSKKRFDVSNLLASEEEKEKLRKEEIFSKDMDRDALLALFHEKDCDIFEALNTIYNDPEKYLNLWTTRDKEYFDAGFERHYSNLRLVARAMGDYKNHKDVIDYHYRYKIPDQFIMYKEIKREQARLMLECVEKRRNEELMRQKNPRMLGSESSSGRERRGSSAPSGMFSKISDYPGAVETRRISAKVFLMEVRDTLGAEKYLSLVNQFKGYESRFISLSQLKKSSCSILEGHDDLIRKFLEFMPTRFRNY